MAQARAYGSNETAILPAMPNGKYFDPTAETRH
jgi:hypothetical protein